MNDFDQFATMRNRSSQFLPSHPPRAKGRGGRGPVVFGRACRITVANLHVKRFVGDELDRAFSIPPTAGRALLLGYSVNC